jgi:hypothetical protein
MIPVIFSLNSLKKHFLGRKPIDAKKNEW